MPIDPSIVGADLGSYTTSWDADDVILYDQASGTLSYDSDGDGAGAANVFARVKAGTVLDAGDFLVV